MLSVVPLLALLIYGLYGSPNLPDQPLAARLEKAGPQQDFAIILARMEAHLAANPGDAKGWSLLAPIYLRQGRYDEAASHVRTAIHMDAQEPVYIRMLAHIRKEKLQHKGSAAPSTPH